MLNIRKIITKYLYQVTVIIIALILAGSAGAHIISVQRQQESISEVVFSQVEQVLEDNRIELEKLKEEYSASCLNNAEAIAYILSGHPALLNDIDGLKYIAGIIGVDEIHVFNSEGVIFTGTNPEYYGFSVEDGEQIVFFKQLLNDKTLKLCQEITPNTAEGKLMQYSALWDYEKKYIIQVGMYPASVEKVMEKYELSYIFSLLRVNPGTDLYAVNGETGIVEGSTNLNAAGKTAEELGFSMDKIKSGGSFRANLEGVYAYCTFKKIDSGYVGRIINENQLYGNILINVVGVAVCLAFISFILVLIVTWCMNKYVISGIYDINKKLREITEGNLDEKVDVATSVEFSELSNHINALKDSLLASTDKLSYVLNRTNMHIGVYEYNEKMKGVRFTEYIPNLLALDIDKTRQLSSDVRLFREYMDKLRENPLTGEDGIYRVGGSRETYVKIDEFTKNNDIVGVVIDVTVEVRKRIRIENERDLDILTGLYNRRGLNAKLDELFANPERLGHGALIMLDADGLKNVNDIFGHEKGDIYLKKISEVISSFGLHSCVSARQGGDEFVLFLYHYESDEEVLKSIETLEFIQKYSTAYLDGEHCVPLKFSFGYCLTAGESDYRQLMRNADEKMYISKRRRKFEDADNID